VTPTTSTSPGPTAEAAAPTEPTHGCARCGTPVPPGVGLCETCNPLGLRDVAASQVHGTVVIAVLVGFVLLAVLARLAITGGGPYPATVGDVVTSGTGLAVTVTVTNEGDGEGQTTCRLQDPSQRAGGPDAFVLSPRIPARSTTTFTAVVDAFGPAPIALAVECRQP
jgi:hypothetical protein